MDSRQIEETQEFEYYEMKEEIEHDPIANLEFAIDYLENARIDAWNHGYQSIEGNIDAGLGYINRAISLILKNMKETI